MTHRSLAITFGDVVRASRSLDVHAKTTGADGQEAGYDLRFEFSDDVPVSLTQVAVAMSTLAGSAYERVEFEFPVDPDVMPLLLRLTKAAIVTGGAETWERTPSGGLLLSFSGGFDSLAAKALMPPETRLVSMDFRGRFSREREFFDRFDTLRVSTNLVDTPLRANSWTFMGIGAILAADYYGAEFHTFGSVMQASPDGFRAAPATAKGETPPPLAAAGYTNAPYVLGLTEIAALTVLLKSYSPQTVADSLVSLASPGEEKLHRKAILVRLVADRIGVTIDSPEVVSPAAPHFAFGEVFSLDVLAMYALHRAGDVLGLVRDVPDEIARAARTWDLSFLERANPVLYKRFPDQLKGGLHKRLRDCGIEWYDDGDRRMLTQLRGLLAPYHPAIAT